MASVEITRTVTALLETGTIEVVKPEDTEVGDKVAVAPPTEPVATEEQLKTDDVAEAEEPKAMEAEAPAAVDETKEVVVEEPAAMVAVENAVEEVGEETEYVTADVAVAGEEGKPAEVVEEASTETSVGKTEE